MKPRPYASINGPRPSPLKINADSHSIRKQSSSPSPSSSSDVASVVTTDMNRKQEVRKPIIIYTHSPKVIHTKAQDFMSLVQRLTGMPRPRRPVQNDDVSAAGTGNLRSSSSNESINSIKLEMKEGNSSGDDGNEITSLTFHKGADNNINVQFNYADVPLFTPNSSDFFSPNSRYVYKYSSDSPFGILGSLISPSGLEFIKELPEY